MLDQIGYFGALAPQVRSVPSLQKNLVVETVLYK
jgi:hypothetical protein